MWKNNAVQPADRIESACGKFPGVTVDRKDGVIKEHPNTRITDLPGIYSMSPYSSEEIVTREFLLQDKPKGIIIL